MKIKHILIVAILTVIVLSYLGIIKINPARTKEVLTKAGRTAAAQVKKIDRAKLTNAARQATSIAKDVAKETKKEYQAQEPAATK